MYIIETMIQNTADLVTFTEKILNKKLNFLCSVGILQSSCSKSKSLLKYQLTQLTFTSSKLTIEPIEKVVKYVQS